MCIAIRWHRHGSVRASGASAVVNGKRRASVNGSPVPGRVNTELAASLHVRPAVVVPRGAPACHFGRGWTKVVSRDAPHVIRVLQFLRRDRVFDLADP